jgi:hypothetical protein
MIILFLKKCSSICITIKEHICWSWNTGSFAMLVQSTVHVQSDFLFCPVGALLVKLVLFTKFIWSKLLQHGTEFLQWKNPWFQSSYGSKFLRIAQAKLSSHLIICPDLIVGFWTCIMVNRRNFQPLELRTVGALSLGILSIKLSTIGTQLASMNMNLIPNNDVCYRINCQYLTRRVTGAGRGGDDGAHYWANCWIIDQYRLLWIK